MPPSSCRDRKVLWSCVIVARRTNSARWPGGTLRRRVAVNADTPLHVLAVEAGRTSVFRLTELSAARSA
jgi:hypothetical protein